MIIKRTTRDVPSLLADADNLLFELEKAIKERSLAVYYQPQLDTKTGSLEHFEALVRWCHPQRGFVSPAIFVPLAEQSGLIESLTELIIDLVKADLDIWNIDGMFRSVAINISASFFADVEIAERLFAKLESIKEHAKAVTLELTETAMVENRILAREFLERSRELGFKISLDDFGTGHASLAHLLDFPIDEIKIDRSFVSQVRESEKSLQIIRSVLFLASALGLDVVAEGIERIEELRVISELGCSRFQGYYFSPPVPKCQLDEAAAWKESA
ncbi:MAG: EAL domain-containing protein [Candidatus Obscuribacterales bacterium]|jgi:EAL domain-containing protein (putative c-di-GMP-specific phosphodiesterase class I)|nr:EAL domain-containing protein [Candidatus Obscuribacterales bacterium]